MRSALMGLAVVTLILACEPCVFAEVQYVKIIESSGSAWIYRPPAPAQDLSVPSFLKKGQKVVTKKSEVELAFNDNLTGLARVGENSRLGMMSEVSFVFFLERGDLLLLREDTREKQPRPVTIVTPELRVEIEQGGCWIQVSEKGTRVKVFGDRLKVSRLKPGRNDPREVEEGFQVFAGPAAPEKGWHVSRLVYADYDPWQAWVKKAYERRDDLEADLVERGGVP